MTAFDVVVTAIEVGLEADVCEVLGRDDADTIARDLPATVARGVEEAGAEQLFHALRAAGASVRLDPAPPRVRHERADRTSEAPVSARPSGRASFAPGMARPSSVPRTDAQSGDGSQPPDSE